MNIQRVPSTIGRFLLTITLAILWLGVSAQNMVLERSLSVSQGGSFGARVVANGGRGILVSPVSGSSFLVTIMGKTPAEDKSFTIGGQTASLNCNGLVHDSESSLYVLNQGILLRINPQTGSLLWSANVGGASHELRVVLGVPVVLRTVSGGFGLVGFAPATGVQTFATVSTPGVASPAFNSDELGRMFLACNKTSNVTTVRGFSSNGTTLWTRDLTGPSLGVPKGSPLIVGTRLSNAGTLLRLNPLTGATLIAQGCDLGVLSGFGTHTEAISLTSFFFSQSFDSNLEPVGESLFEDAFGATSPILAPMARTTAVLYSQSENGFDFVDVIRAANDGRLLLMNTLAVRSLHGDNLGRLYVLRGNGAFQRHRLKLNPNRFFTIPFDQLTFTERVSDESDLESAQFILTQLPLHGSVTFNPNGTFTYQANGPAHVVDTFRVRVVEGAFEDIVTVAITRQAKPDAFVLSSKRVKGGNNISAQLQMSGPAIGTMSVPLSENSTATALSVSSATVPSGSSASNPFTIFTARVPATVVATISAEGGLSTQVTIDPPFITSLVAHTPTVLAGSEARFTVNLDAPAPTNGLTVFLAGSSGPATVPSTVIVPAGATQASFGFMTGEVTTFVNMAITATSNGITKAAAIKIVRLTFFLNPTSIVGGATSTGTIRLGSTVVGSPVVFQIADNSTATAPSPTSLTFGVGAQELTFSVISVPVTTTRVSTFTVTSQGIQRTASVNVTAPVVINLLLQPSSVRGGNSTVGFITLNGKAPAGGTVVTLTSASTIVTVPASATVAAGQTGVQFFASTRPVTQTLMIVVTARTGSITKSTTLIVTP